MTKSEKEEKEKEKREEELRKKFKRRSVLIPLIAALFPYSAEREYKRFLRKYTKELNAIVKEAQYGMAHGKSKNDAIKGAMSKIGQLGSKYKIKAEIGKIAKHIELGQSKMFENTIKKTFGIDLSLKKLSFEKIKDDWLKKNLMLFALLTDGVIKGMRDDDNDDPKLKFTDVLKIIKKFVDDMPANQVGNYYSSVVDNIYRTFGIDEYIWRTKRDSRVRKCHATFDGHRFKLDSPPEIWYETKAGRVYTGRHCHPGQDYNCRCWMIPVFKIEIINKLIKWLDDK